MAIDAKKALSDIVTIEAYKEKGWLKPYYVKGKLSGFRFHKDHSGILTGADESELHEFALNLAANFKDESLYNSFDEYNYDIVERVEGVYIVTFDAKGRLNHKPFWKFWL